MPKVKNNNADNLIILDREINEPIGDYAVRCLEYNIINMTLLPGTFISEKIVSEILSISRTPIREAFSRLEKINLIEIYPQKGTRVSLIDTSIVEETSFMRMVLEKEIIKMVCKNHSEKDLKLLNNRYLPTSTIFLVYPILYHKETIFPIGSMLRLSVFTSSFNKAEVFAT